jgi:hypothetical protein
MAWSRLPLDWSTVAKCGISAADLDEARLAIEERIDQIDAETCDDDFTNEVLHANRWKQRNDDYPAVEEGGALTCSLPDENLTVSTGRSGADTRVITRSAWAISGDLDIQVGWEYTPSSDETPIRLGFNLRPSGYFSMIKMVQESGQKKLWAYLNNSTTLYSNSQNTTATSGTFRITRVDNKMRWYNDSTLIGEYEHDNTLGRADNVQVGLRARENKTAGWGGESATFADFTITAGTVKWYRQDATDDTLDSISLPDVAAFGEVWPVSAVNAYRSALEAIIPYFFDGVETPTRYTKASLLTAAISATDWTDSPLSALLVPAKRQHLNDLYEACRKAIYLPSDDDVDDNGFDEPSWDYPD